MIIRLWVSSVCTFGENRLRDENFRDTIAKILTVKETKGSYAFFNVLWKKLLRKRLSYTCSVFRSLHYSLKKMGRVSGIQYRNISWPESIYSLVDGKLICKIKECFGMAVKKWLLSIQMRWVAFFTGSEDVRVWFPWRCCWRSDLRAWKRLVLHSMRVGLLLSLGNISLFRFWNDSVPWKKWRRKSYFYIAWWLYLFMKHIAMLKLTIERSKRNQILRSTHW